MPWALSFVLVWQAEITALQIIMGKLHHSNVCLLHLWPCQGGKGFYHNKSRVHFCMEINEPNISLAPFLFKYIKLESNSPIYFEDVCLISQSIVVSTFFKSLKLLFFLFYCQGSSPGTFITYH